MLPQKRKRRQKCPSALSRNQPRRNRTLVSYAEIDSGDELIYRSGEEYDCPAAARKKARPLPERKVFPFLSLPRELRDLVYQECLVDALGGAYVEDHTVRYRRTPARNPAGPQNLMGDYGGRSPHGVMPRWPHPEDHQHAANTTSFVPPPLAPALLLACRQVFAEAAPLLYGQPLYFEDGCALHGFLAALSPATRGLLRHVTVLEEHRWRSLKKSFDVAAFTLLAEGAASIECLRFTDVFCRWLEPPRQGARRLYRRLYRWLEVRRKERGSDAAVGLVQIIDRDCEVWSMGDPDLGYWEHLWRELRRLVVENSRKW